VRLEQVWIVRDPDPDPKERALGNTVFPWRVALLPVMTEVLGQLQGWESKHITLYTGPEEALTDGVDRLRAIGSVDEQEILAWRNDFIGPVLNSNDSSRRTETLAWRKALDVYLEAIEAELPVGDMRALEGWHVHNHVLVRGEGTCIIRAVLEFNFRQEDIAAAVRSVSDGRAS
jgi:hypothetical protein